MTDDEEAFRLHAADQNEAAARDIGRMTAAFQHGYIERLSSAVDDSEESAHNVWAASETFAHAFLSMAYLGRHPGEVDDPGYDEE